MRFQFATILNAILSIKYVHANSTAPSYRAVPDIQNLPPFTVNNRRDAKRFLRALVGVNNEAMIANLAKWSAELKEALNDDIDPVMGVVNNVNILKNLAPDLSIEAKASEIPFPVRDKDKVHKALLLLSGNSNYLEAVTDKPQLLQKYLNLLETESDHSSPAVVEAMNAIRSDWDKYKKLLDHLNLKKQSTMLTEWLGEKAITADTFKVLTSDVKEEDLYNGKLLAAFDTYVQIYNTKHPTERLSLLAVLTVCFGDFRVAQMIDTAKSFPAFKEMAKLAKELETSQIDYWLDARKTSDDVAHLLRIGSPLLELSETAMISRWLKFVNELSKHEKETSVYPIKTLKSLYSYSSLNFEIWILKLLSKESDLEKESAKLLEASLTRHWFNSLKTPDQLETLFESESLKSFDGKNYNYAALLKRYKRLYKRFAVPSQSSKYSKLKFVSGLRGKSWYKSAFAELKIIIFNYNKNQPIEKLSLFAALTVRCGEREASTTIDEAMRVENTMQIAKTLEAEQIQSWIDNKKTPDEVFKLLDFESWSWGYKWVKFCDKFSLRHPKLAFDPFEKLREYFSDDVLAMFVVMATSEKLDNAERYGDMLVWRWFEEMKTPEQLEAQLRQNVNKHRFLPLLKKYSEFYKNLGYFSTLNIIGLRHSTGGITSNMLHILTSTNAKMNLHDGSVLAAIDAYVRLYNKANTREPLSLLAALTARLGHRDASTVIEAAKAVPNLAKTAKKLETEQMQFWVDTGMTPNQVIYLLDPKSQGLAMIYRYIKFLNVYNKRLSESLLDPVRPLRDHFTDAELATFAVEGVGKESDDAKQLQAMLLRSWFNNMMSSEDVAKLLYMEGDNLTNFESLLKTYKNYQRWGGRPSR